MQEKEYINLEDHAHNFKRLYLPLSVIAGLIGISMSVVSCYFLVIGMRQTEHNSIAQVAMSAAGVLITAASLFCYFVPQIMSSLRGWKIFKSFGFALLCFGIAQLAITQYIIVESSEFNADHLDSEIRRLEETALSHRQNAKEYRNNSANNTTKLNVNGKGWMALEKAKLALSGNDKATGLINSANKETALADAAETKANDLKSQKRPTLFRIIGGATGMKIYCFVRGLCIELGGPIFMGVCGWLLSMHFKYRDIKNNKNTITENPNDDPSGGKRLDEEKVSQESPAKSPVISPKSPVISPVVAQKSPENVPENLLEKSPAKSPQESSISIPIGDPVSPIADIFKRLDGNFPRFNGSPERLLGRHKGLLEVSQESPAKSPVISLEKRENPRDRTVRNRAPRDSWKLAKVQDSEFDKIKKSILEDGHKPAVEGLKPIVKMGHDKIKWSLEKLVELELINRKGNSYCHVATAKVRKKREGQERLTLVKAG